MVAKFALLAVLVAVATAQPQAQAPLTVAGRPPIQPHETLSGRTEAEIQEFLELMGPKIVGGLPPPVPVEEMDPEDATMRRVNNDANPYRDPRSFDVRGPCPGMNTMANHGYMSRTGVDSPGNIVTAVQRAYNMGWDIATFITYASLLVEGNPLTNLLSIGRHTELTGPDPEGYAQAVTGGIATHGPFEGDSSQSRADFHWGDQVAFNETIFQQFIDDCDRWGGGTYSYEAASRMREQRYWHSRLTNPTFTFDIPRYNTAYAETTFPMAFFNDGRRQKEGKYLDCRAARTFYEHHRMPEDFHKRGSVFHFQDATEMVWRFKNISTIEAGRNLGLGNFVKAYPEVQDTLDLQGNCAMYRYFLTRASEIYPNPTGILRRSLQINAHNMWIPLGAYDLGCPEVFPWGKLEEA